MFKFLTFSLMMLFQEPRSQFPFNALRSSCFIAADSSFIPCPFLQHTFFVSLLYKVRERICVDIAHLLMHRAGSPRPAVSQSSDLVTTSYKNRKLFSSPRGVFISLFQYHYLDPSFILKLSVKMNVFSSNHVIF